MLQSGFIRSLALVMAVTFSPVLAEDPTTQYVAELMALTKSCGTPLEGKTWETDKQAWNNGRAAICGDHMSKGAVYWTADMDIDCDGKVTPGKCDKEHDCCFQAQTAFQNSKGEHLTAAVDPYYVIPNNFPLSKYQIAKWQIAAVIYKGKLTYTFLADTGPPNIIGEASYATAVILGIDPDARTGGTPGPVTYIVFTGAIGRPTIPEDHQQVMEVGAKAAEAFLKANGVSMIKEQPKADTRFSFHRKTFRVDLDVKHALQVNDAKGNVVLWKTAEGAAEHDLSSLNPGVYYVKTVTAGRKVSAPRKVVLY